MVSKIGSEMVRGGKMVSKCERERRVEEELTRHVQFLIMVCMPA